MTMKLFYYAAIILFVVSCTDRLSNATTSSTNENEYEVVKIGPSALDSGKFFTRNGHKYLYGGEDSLSHFLIDNLDLNNSQFHCGMGREAFPALHSPKFQDVKSADSIRNDTTRFLAGIKNEEVKCHSIPNLTRCEVVNDTLAGEPIMIAYCILADLGAIYSRQYNNQTLTFALNGHTYYDQNTWGGLDGFALWDRETESL